MQKRRVTIPKSVYQSFAESADRTRAGARLAALRAELARRGLDGFIVPRSDEHQNEYVPPSAERLAWLTGFTGSAGHAIVLSDRAAIFVDGRYTAQVREQVDGNLFDYQHLGDDQRADWLEKRAPKGGRIGYDPWLHTAAGLKRLASAAEAAGASLVPTSPNPVDAIWADRPAPPLGAVVFQPDRLAGESATKKAGRVREALGKDDGLVVTDAHAVAWLFNIRGADVKHTPLPLAFAFVPREGKPKLYVDARKLSNRMRDDLSALADIDDARALVPDLQRLGKAAARLRFDAATAPAILARTLEEAGGKADAGADPIALMKAVKNRVELAGARAAHARDGAAMTRFLAWFDSEAPKGGLTEISAAEALESFRRDTGKLRDVSFPSISGAGPHAALPHYHVTERSNLPIRRGLYLIDSGAQYVDGTTDVTRTLAVGAPTAEMRDRFTRVLKGMIAISMSVFPKGTSGARIDALARQSLWQAGLDFDHGVGHGVGSYLSVHEGPQRISRLGVTPLEPGMILSNEPGYYKTGHWGIRIENLLVVEQRRIARAEHEMHGFETITLAPIDVSLIDNRLLTRFEIAWLDAYHARVRKTLSPLVDAPARRFLNRATRPISRV